MNHTEEELKQEIRKLEEALKDEKQRTAYSTAILESGNLIVWTVDIDGQLVSFNQNYFHYFLPTSTSSKIYYEKDGKLRSSKAETFWQNKYRKILKGERVNLEVQIKTESGNEWKEVFLNPVYDNDIEIIAISGVAYDITEKTESRKKLKSSEEKFRNIFESFQDLYFRTNFKGNITMLSPSVKDILGYDEKKMIGKNATNYYIYNIKIKSLLRDLISNGSVRNFETGIIHKSGKVIPCICNIRIISHKGKPQYIEGVARDITELKKTNEELQFSKEVAEKSLKVKERFLANMSHEIKTPLNGIIGMINLIDEKDLNRENLERFISLKSSADILMGVLNDLLDLSKIEAGKMELKNSVVNTQKFFEKLKTLYQYEAERNNISLSFEIGNKIPENILADEIKLMQVFSNLISNAIKFTAEEGSIRVSLTVEKEKKKGGLKLKGQVLDTGIGIEESSRKHLFKSFSQLDSSTSKSYKGTGLGLYISKKLVELMGGDIEVENNNPKGSKFWFTFDSIEISASADVSELNEEVSLSTQSNVLVVDDNSVNLQIASEILRKSGCRVTSINNGKKAVKSASKEKFDLIFMDIQMPDLDGVETSKRIRKIDLNKNTPIIAMTAYSMAGDREKYLSSGMDDYISKPILPESLVYTVKKWTDDEHPTAKKSKKKHLKSSLNTLDFNTLENLMKFGGKEMVVETLNEFNNECKSQVASLKEEFSRNNFEDILVILHTLKGNAGTLGVQKIAFWAEYMEEEVKKKNYHIFESNLEELQNLYSEFKIAIKQF
ncbi:response regulator [Fulvivirga lutea]|uniref:histidine kinase n=1 Tax=Fulvivirga lutea TaxID=2810512 RepID=A0A974WGS9_9BACT|nr:response regulator [Fulvivirga lutea]QSE96937.1 response regulator [Fulvivirga lutea]